MYSTNTFIQTKKGFKHINSFNHINFSQVQEIKQHNSNFHFFFYFMECKRITKNTHFRHIQPSLYIVMKIHEIFFPLYNNIIMHY